jgi:two-component system sensor histidine kinase BaeS
MGRRWLGPLGARLAVAFVGVALAAIAVFAAVILLAERAGVANLADRQQAQTTDAIVAALQDAYRPAGGWAAANLTPAVTLADSAGVAMVVVGPDGQPVLQAGSQRLFSAEGSERKDQVLTVGSRPVGTVRLAFPAGGLSTSERHLRTTLTDAVGWSAALAILGALLVALVVARSLVRPIRRLSAAARALGEGASTVRVGDRAGPGELGELGRAFDTMAGSLEREDQLRRALVADVAHELRTPIAVLQAETEALVDRMTEPSPAALISLHDEAVRLGRMVEDLQTLASAEAAGLHLDRRLLDVGRVAGQAADALSPRFRAAGISLEQTVPPTFVVGDPHRLYQVVSNLLANAAKFTPAGGQVSLRVASDGPDALIEVSDTGPGIPEGELSQVWDRFFRGSAGQAVAGSGIGLAVVKELVEAHGGSVAVHSSGRGACFVVRLPQATAPDWADQAASR